MPTSKAVPDRSPASDHSVILTFANRLTISVAVSWVDFDGHEVFYRQLAPGESYQQQTFTGHVWVVRTENGTERERFAAPATDSEVSIH
ncbi:hypothetical protein [Actinokineospora enzanensis]|uniref:VHL beta domain-containing protein n=1 Tax=Actinokineospora enzanensis TaxID=155975 RepID=UPI0007C537D1|nr:hypothetical protein [Actinokineospora enzanensis]